MINGITFDSRQVRARDDGIVRSKIFGDGILAGCAMTFSGKDLTIGVGSFLVAGRQIEVSIAETITSSTTEANGYGRLRFVIDLTAEPSETVFTQYRWEWDYQSANSGWPVLTQEDINADGDTYEVAMATVSFSASNAWNRSSILASSTRKALSSMISSFAEDRPVVSTSNTTYRSCCFAPSLREA